MQHTTDIIPKHFSTWVITIVNAIVDVEGSGSIPAFKLGKVFEKFGAELGQEECAALLSAIDCTDDAFQLTFDHFLVCMAVLVNA